MFIILPKRGSAWAGGGGEDKFLYGHAETTIQDAAKVEQAEGTAIPTTAIPVVADVRTEVQA
jgi:hypothetical protein